MLSFFHKDATYYFAEANIPRALPVDELADQANAIGLNGTSFEDVNIALSAAIKNANQQDLILVIGSVFLVAEVDRNQFL